MHEAAFFLYSALFNESKSETYSAIRHCRAMYTIMKIIFYFYNLFSIEYNQVLIVFLSHSHSKNGTLPTINYQRTRLQSLFIEKLKLKLNINSHVLFRLFYGWSKVLSFPNMNIREPKRQRWYCDTFKVFRCKSSILTT